MSADCPFCGPDADRIFHIGRRVLGIWDAYPVNPGHALLVPKRHVASWFETTVEEQRELLESIQVARVVIEKNHEPDGFNIGLNIGDAAGQTVPHLHLHVIPRYSGDMADPRGGVRGVIPEKQNYLGDAPDGSSIARDREDVPPDVALQALIRGGEDDPLLPHLKSHLDAARSARFAVAFVLPSGVDLLDEHLRDLCERGGCFQFLTGDYQGVTDPDALERLLDIQKQYEDHVDLRVYSTANRLSVPKTHASGAGALRPRQTGERAVARDSGSSPTAGNNRRRSRPTPLFTKSMSVVRSRHPSTARRR